MRAAGGAAPCAVGRRRRRRAPASRAPWPGRTSARSSTSAIRRQTRTDGLVPPAASRWRRASPHRPASSDAWASARWLSMSSGLLRRQPAHDADALQRIALARRLEIERGEIGMRRQRPAALQGLHRALGVARLDLQLGEPLGRRRCARAPGRRPRAPAPARRCRGRRARRRGCARPAAAPSACGRCRRSPPCGACRCPASPAPPATGRVCACMSNSECTTHGVCGRSAKARSA